EAVNNNNDNNVSSSLDVSADSLPSPHSESFPSEEDPSGGTSRRERRHREGGKKKKKDRDKEEGGRKRKKHHREKHPLAEMASEIVSPFRIKIKPLPPRPNGSEAHAMPLSAPPVITSHSTHTSSHSTHTTSTTTTAPPGYPPLPPGYKLTQPMISKPNVASQDCINGPSMSGNISQSSLSAACNNSISVSTSNNSNGSMVTSVSTSASSSGTRPSNVGRRKSDPSADQFSKCDVCGETGGVTNTVMCDECLKAYHFNCLEPPLKRSPKRRGYSWFCEDCDNAAANSHDNK
ncbi:hypothetical protein Anas_00689, partial [Armadillidium nasatum]